MSKVKLTTLLIAGTLAASAFLPNKVQAQESTESQVAQLMVAQGKQLVSDLQTQLRQSIKQQLSKVTFSNADVMQSDEKIQVAKRNDQNTKVKAEEE